MHVKGDWARRQKKAPQEEMVKAPEENRGGVELHMSKTPLTSKAKFILTAMEKLGYVRVDEQLAKEVAALRAGNAVSVSIIQTL